MQISSQWRHNVHKGKQLKTRAKMHTFFSNLRGPGGGGGGGDSIIRLSLSWSQAIISPISICTCEIRKQSEKNF